MGRGRPGGNPDFGSKYGFKPKGNQPLSRQITLKVTEEVYARLEEVGSRTDFIRKAIDKALEELDSQKISS